MNPELTLLDPRDLKDSLDQKVAQVASMQELISQLQENEERLQAELSEKEDELHFCRA